MNATTPRGMLDEVEADIAETTAKLRELEAVKKYLAAKFGMNTAPIANGDSGNHRDPAAGQRFKKMNQREAAYTILSEADRPMRANEIVKLMIDGGYPWTSKPGKLRNSVFTTMTRDDKRFKKVGEGLWETIKPEQG
jgi:hypothetical protein